MAMKKLKKKLEDAELSGLERFMQQLEKGLRKNTHAIETGLGVTATGLLVRLIFGVGSGGSRWNDVTKYQVSWTIICFVLYIGFVWLSYLKDRMEIDIKSRSGVSDVNSEGLSDYHYLYTEWMFKRANRIDEDEGYIKAQQFLEGGAAEFGVITVESINAKLALMQLTIANIKHSDDMSKKKFDQRSPAPAPIIPKKETKPNLIDGM